MTPVSGTVPYFDLSAVADPGGVTVVSVAGGASGAATGAISTEPLNYFYRRALGLLALSGTLSGSDQVVSGSIVSGIRNLQQELALRAADIEMQGAGNNKRLELANAILTASGEVQFGE